jgi:hypothetical protein
MPQPIVYRGQTIRQCGPREWRIDNWKRWAFLSLYEAMDWVKFLESCDRWAVCPEPPVPGRADVP